MNRSTVDLWVGIFVVAGMAGLLFLALKVGNLAFPRDLEPEQRSLLSAAEIPLPSSRTVDRLIV